MKNCPGCQAAVGAERFCRSCGSAIPQFAASDPPSVTTIDSSPTPTAAETAARPVQPSAPAGESAPSDSVGGASCELCGCSPALSVSFKQGIGLLLARRVSTQKGNLCRDCGQCVGREATNRTLWTGWWGAISFLANFTYLFGNARDLLRLNRLGAPNGPTWRALSPGKSVFARSGVWFAAGLALVAIAAAGGQSEEPSSSYSWSSPPNSESEPVLFEEPQLEWEVGACARATSSAVELADCDGYYNARVVEVVSNPRLCPYTSESYVQIGLRVYCVDEQ